MLTALAIVFVFGLLVLFHEFGHYIAAKWHGIKVLEFAFGFGPKLVSIQPKETVYSIRLFPLGGFVRLHGMDPEIDADGKVLPPDPNDERNYENKKIWQKMTIMVAGSLMNFVLALLLFVGVYTVIGIPQASTSNVIGTVVEGNPAAEAGLRPGERIIAVNGIETPDWASLTREIHSRPEQELTLTVQSGDQIRTVRLTTIKDEQTGKGLIGIAGEVVYNKSSILDSMRYGIKMTVEFTSLIIVTIFQMITGQIPADVGGPVAIAQAIGEGARQGLANLLGLTGILSIQLGLINLFPFPALDGGQLVVLAFEGIRGKPLSPEKKGFIQLTGFILLLTLMIVITYQDILRLLQQD